MFLQKYDKLCQHLMASFRSLSISSIICKVMVDINQHILRKRGLFYWNKNSRKHNSSCDLLVGKLNPD